jgi:hypothetical protein
MRNEVLKIIRKGLADALAERDVRKQQYQVQNLVIRIPELTSRLKGTELSEHVDRWFNELYLSGPRAIAKIVDEIDRILDKNEMREIRVCEYLMKSFPQVEGDVARILDSAIDRGLALPGDPPWQYKRDDSLNDGDVLVLVNASSVASSTEKLLEQFRQLFQRIVNLGHPRPKLWILPTTTRGRVVIAMGKSDVVSLLLNPVFQFHISRD